MLDSRDLQLAPLTPGSVIKSTDVLVQKGGSLLCGAYQYSYRLYDENSQKFSKWSILSTPISVFKNLPEEGANGLAKRVTASIGEQSECKVRISVTISSGNTANFTHIQLGIVEHVGNLGSNNPTTAGLLGLTSLATAQSATGVYTLEHKTNKVEQRIDINEIVIPLANIKNAKTVSIDDNRLFLGNVEYNNLAVSTVTPPTVTGAIDTKLFKTNLSNPNNQNHYTGYSRDVYRFAIAYYDEDYNFSAPVPLDMRNVLGNTISSGLTDMKFDEGGNFGMSPFKLGNVGTTQSGVFANRILHYGLNLQVNNHPTWAKGAIILRAKRIKDFLFETPLVTVTEIRGVGPVGFYPDKFEKYYTSGSPVERDLPTAQPMNPVGTFMPSNMLRSHTGIFRGGDVPMLNTVVNLPINRIDRGELIFSSESNRNKFCILTPQMYNNDTRLVEPFTLTGTEKVVVREGIFTTAQVSKSSDTGLSTQRGKGKDTSAALTYHIINSNDYYVPSNRFTKRESKIIDFSEITNAGEGTLLDGQPFGQYDNLKVEGAGWDLLPQNNRMGVIQTENLSLFDVYSTGITVDYPNPNDNTFSIFSDTQSTINTKKATVFTIAEIRKGLSDDRYGDVGAQHEYIYTGAHATITGRFNQATFNVWGGDCRTSYHDFSFTTSHFALANARNPTSPTSKPTITEQFGGLFRNSYNEAVSLPVPYRSFRQSVTLPLRGEVNGEIVDQGGGVTEGPVFSIDQYVPTRLKHDKQSFFNYAISPAAIKEGDAQVFFPKPQFSIDNSKFTARIVYSDLKIYQTSDDSFSKIRVLNTFDLDESAGELVRLTKLSDYTYAIQNRAIKILPINTSQIETSDGATLSVRTGDVIGKTRTLTNLYGISKPENLINTRQALVGADFNNKVVFRLSKDLEILSDMGINETTFDSISLNTTFMHDTSERQLYLVFEGDAPVYVFNEMSNLWESTLPKSSTALGSSRLTGVNLEDEFFVIRQGTMYKQHQSISNSFIGTYFTPSIGFVINENKEFGKVFDNVILHSNVDISSITYTIRDQGLDDETTGLTFTPSKSREGYFIRPLRRVSDNQRIRGRFVEANMILPVSSDLTLKSVMHKYRISSRAL